MAYFPLSISLVASIGNFPVPYTFKPFTPEAVVNSSCLVTIFLMPCFSNPFMKVSIVFLKSVSSGLVYTVEIALVVKVLSSFLYAKTCSSFMAAFNSGVSSVSCLTNTPGVSRVIGGKP